MVYIALSLPYRDYNRVRISSIHFYDKEGSKTLNFKYEIYKQGTNRNILFEETISLTDQNFISSISALKSEGQLTAYDTICKKLLDYLIQSAMETGTLEIE